LIATRTGAAVALLLAVVAVALGMTAFMSTVRDEKEKPGRMVQTRLTQAYAGDPVSFPLDEFYIGHDSNGRLRALYVYPPGFYGHTRGCKVVWSPDEFIAPDHGPGLFVDPCGGARFDRDGMLVAGPADHGLDYFATVLGVEGMFVDTRTLYCGRPYQAPSVTPQPAVATPPALSSGTPIPTATATATDTPLPTATGSATATRTPDRGPLKCDRVKNTSKR
jgi:hypothetical protein